MAENNPAMLLADMRRLLQTQKPLNCAIGTVKNQSAILLDLRKEPMFLRRQLGASQPDLKEPCHGRAVRDPDDANHLMLDLNKGNKGTARRLTKTLHGTSIRKVSILLDDKLFETADAEEDKGKEKVDSEEHETSSAEPAPFASSSAAWSTATPSTRPTPGMQAQQAAPESQRTENPAQQVLGELGQMARGIAASGLTRDQQTTLAAQLRTAQSSAMAGDLTTARGIIAQVGLTLRSGSSSTSPSSNGSDQGVSSGQPAWASASTIRPIGGPRVVMGRSGTPATGNGATPLAAPQVQNVGQQSATLQAQQDFSRALHSAQGDIKAAQAMPSNGGLAPGKQTFAQLVADMTQKAANKDYAGAIQALPAVRSAALQLAGQSHTMGAQRESHDRMSSVLANVEKTYFTKTSGDALRMADLKAGPEFQSYVAAVSTFEQSRTPEACDGIRGAAEGYLRHYQSELSQRQQNTKESQAKRGHAVAGYIGAGHMKMALEMKRIGPPPWDEDTATKVASMRAAFAFESVNKSAVPLGGESGVSASFWVKGFNVTEQDNPDAQQTEFLFKPKAGEDDIAGFPEGGSAPREAASKALADMVRGMSGLDLGVPETNIVTVDPRAVDAAGYNKLKRESPDYSDGQALLPLNQPLLGSMQKFVGSKGPLKDQPAGTMANMPAAECQKAGILDILTLNCDRHQGNFMVGDRTDANGGTTDTLIPIDHGLTLPTREGLKIRGKDRMNNPGGNALLKMPASYAPFSQDNIDRIDMIDPDELEAGLKRTIASMDRVQPGLGASQALPDESVDLARRAAMFLKRACRHLSPAEIQIVMASKQAEIFDVDEQQFVQSVDAVIAAAAAQSVATKTLFCDEDLPAVCERLRTNGWLSWNGRFDAPMEKFRIWLADNASVALAAYNNNAAPPPGWVTPT